MQMMQVKILERSFQPSIVAEDVGGKTIYFASHPYLTGVVAQGETEQSARQLFKVNLEHYIAYCQEVGLPIPQPTHMQFEIELTGTSGVATAPDQSIAIHSSS